MKKIYLSLLAVAALAGCSKSEMPETPRDGIIRIASSVETSLTKAAVDDTQELTNVQFLRKDVAADAAIPDTYFTGVTAIAGTRKVTANKPIEFAVTPTYLLNDDKVYFVAYHPVGTVASEVASWTINGKTDILLTPVWDAGKYSAPKTGEGSTSGDPMIFKHQLAQLEVVCKAFMSDGTAESAVQSAWGKITKIELMNTPGVATYTYATNVVGFTGATDATGLALLNVDSYDADFVSGNITENSANETTASGMFAPELTVKQLKIKITTEKVTAGVIVSVDLADGGTNKAFERGLKHKVTLSFKADTKDIDVLSTQIETWGAGYAGSGVIEKPTT